MAHLACVPCRTFAEAATTDAYARRIFWGTKAACFNRLGLWLKVNEALEPGRRHEFLGGNVIAFQPVGGELGCELHEVFWGDSKEWAPYERWELGE